MVNSFLIIVIEKLIKNRNKRTCNIFSKDVYRVSFVISDLFAFDSKSFKEKYLHFFLQQIITIK